MFSNMMMGGGLGGLGGGGAAPQFPQISATSQAGPMRQPIPAVPPPQQSNLLQILLRMDPQRLQQLFGMGAGMPAQTTIAPTGGGLWDLLKGYVSPIA